MYRDNVVKEVKKNLKIMLKTYLLKTIKKFLTPLDYTRTKEIPSIIKLSGILEFKDKELYILDIGSPQILSIILASSSKNWNITYINPFQKELDILSEEASMMGLKNINIIKDDITNLRFDLTNYFDFIFSCSVFEHIYPEKNGDIIASRNILKLLKQDGYFLISVPYTLKAFNEYKNEDVYHIKKGESSKLFFQRFYDQETLEKRILEPSMLKVKDMNFIGERYYFKNNIHRRTAHLFSGKYLSKILGRFYFLLSNIFLIEDINYRKLSKPYIAIVKLLKS